MHRSRQLVASLAIAAVATLVAATTAAADSDLNGDGRTDILCNEMAGDGLNGAQNVGNLLLIDGYGDPSYVNR